jgi:hypothetical protein
VSAASHPPPAAPGASRSSDSEASAGAAPSSAGGGGPRRPDSLRARRLRSGRGASGGTDAREPGGPPTSSSSSWGRQRAGGKGAGAGAGHMAWRQGAQTRLCRRPPRLHRPARPPDCPSPAETRRRLPGRTLDGPRTPPPPLPARRAAPLARPGCRRRPCTPSAPAAAACGGHPARLRRCCRRRRRCRPPAAAAAPAAAPARRPLVLAPRARAPARGSARAPAARHGRSGAQGARRCACRRGPAGARALSAARGGAGQARGPVQGPWAAAALPGAQRGAPPTPAHQVGLPGCGQRGAAPVAARQCRAGQQAVQRGPERAAQGLRRGRRARRVGGARRRRRRQRRRGGGRRRRGAVCGVWVTVRAPPHLLQERLGQGGPVRRGGGVNHRAAGRHPAYEKERNLWMPLAAGAPQFVAGGASPRQAAHPPTAAPPHTPPPPPPPRPRRPPPPQAKAATKGPLLGCRPSVYRKSIGPRQAGSGGAAVLVLGAARRQRVGRGLGTYMSGSAGRRAARAHGGAGRAARRAPGAGAKPPAARGARAPRCGTGNRFGGTCVPPCARGAAARRGHDASKGCGDGGTWGRAPN